MSLLGFNPELFLDGVQPEFICSICLSVLKNPVLVFPCEHVYCSSCLFEWMKSNQSCPQDRTPLTVDKIFRSPLVFRQLLDRLRLHCPRSCGDVFSYSAIEQHRLSCPKEEVQCNMCPALIPRCELAAHSSSVHTPSARVPSPHASREEVYEANPLTPPPPPPSIVQVDVAGDQQPAASTALDGGVHLLFPRASLPMEPPQNLHVSQFLSPWFVAPPTPAPQFVAPPTPAPQVRPLVPPRPAARQWRGLYARLTTPVLAAETQPAQPLHVAQGQGHATIEPAARPAVPPQAQPEARPSVAALLGIFEAHAPRRLSSVTGS